MGAEDSVKKLRRKKNSQLAHKANQVDRLSIKKMTMKKKKDKSLLGLADKVDAKMFGMLPNIQEDMTHKSSGEKKMSRNSRNGKKIRARAEDLGEPQSDEVTDERYVESEPAEDTSHKGGKKKKRTNAESVKKVVELNEQDGVRGQVNESKPEDHIQKILLKRHNKADTRKISKSGILGKSKNPGKSKKKGQSLKNKVSRDNLLEIREDTEDDVYEMSSGDEDNSKGMKKWITQYHQSRPGLKLLQEKIDDFIIDHEAKEEEARVARESQAAEGGWTVVVHHKGRKRTTDAESGIAMGSVAQAVIEDKLANKKTKGVGLDFYRFQKREAHRNEIMMLQSQFEQDKKRIQQLRAARKFRPY